MEGLLSKWTNDSNGWQERYFLLDSDQAELTYYSSKEKSKKKNPRGRFSLKDSFVGVDDVEDAFFSLTSSSDNSIVYFQAKNEEEKMSWVNKIEEVISQLEEVKPVESTFEIYNIVSNDVQSGKSLIEVIYEETLKLRTSLENPREANLIVDNLQNNLSKLSIIFTDIDQTLRGNQTTRQSVSQVDSAEFVDCVALQSDDETINEDVLYGVDQSPARSSPTSNQSVIKHLLKQVRVGMDLTRITLPTFILERRSLLEMLADFFSHCDFFARITNVSNPCDRMVEMVRAYLSCFHAGRNPDIAKKPYNPILGEIFRCYWKLEDSANLMKTGPIPWATDGDMTFLVEQVSHHPPVSAFYAENRSKKFSIEGQIWTKSRFQGLSVGVDMIGETRIRLDEHNETYTISFPSGYARSIFSVPWFELGGKVELKATTGYSAAVNFHTKPVYKNTKNEVTAEIFAPGKKSLCTVKGTWNGVMTVSYSKDQEPQVFFDCKNTLVMKKFIQPLKVQEPNESRRLWYDVTKNLFKEDITQATFYKSKLEEKQRSERKQRIEKNIEYEPKYFKLNGGTWKYVG